VCEGVRVATAWSQKPDVGTREDSLAARAAFQVLTLAMRDKEQAVGQPLRDYPSTVGLFRSWGCATRFQLPCQDSTSDVFRHRSYLRIAETAAAHERNVGRLNPQS
jgi:hypothetical protein